MITVDIRKQEKRRKRYTLSQLLQGATPKKMAALNAKTAWAREGKAVGREIEFSRVISVIDPA